MTHTFQFSRRIGRLRAPVFSTIIVALAGCDATETFDTDGSTVPDAVDAPMGGEPGVGAFPTDESTLAAASRRRGIPIGSFALPVSEYGSRFNGGHKNIAPNRLLKELAAIRARGGRVALMFAGSERHYKEGGHFSLSKWKQRVNRYRGINFSSYVNDGTIIGHYMIDEPNDPANWRGKRVPPSVLEEMAKYSKRLWPRMVTIVRAEPGYLAHNHRYLDAAWAQYLSRKGTPDAFIRRNVAEAQRRRVQLIVGLNFLRGGTPNGRTMTSKQVESWGSALLRSSYPCAFISWTYNSRYLSSRSMKNAMTALRRRAENRSTKSCRS